MDGLVVASAVARLLQYAAAAGGGAALFLTYGARTLDPRPWRRGLAGLFALAAVAVVAWLMAQAGLFGSPSDAFDPATVWSVAADTVFGRAALARAVLFAATAAIAATGAWRATVIASALATASFAFGGHAAGDEGVTKLIHQTADIAHVWSAAIWLGALPPLLLLLRRGRTADARAGLDAFSAVGPAVVAVLVLSGMVNTWLIVGPSHLRDVPGDAWGRLLLGKLGLLALMLLMAAANRWRLAPRLDGATAPAALAALKRSLLLETLAGLAVLILVSRLGALPPPGSS